MNLLELKKSIDSVYSTLPSYVSPEEISVCITLSETSIGSRASVGVSHCLMGFDWEAGQFRIEPSKEIVKKGNSLLDIKPIKYFKIATTNNISSFCPVCEMRVAKIDKFCRNCGQRFK